MPAPNSHDLVRPAPLGSYAVREATEADLATVHELVRELASFEHLAHEVDTSPETYRADLREGWFRCLVAVDAGDRPVGAMIYYLAYSTWKGRMLYLEDFIVASTHRRIGLGELLWQGLVDVARTEGCTSIKWQVLEWNDSAKRFYDKMGASREGGWENGRLYL